MTKKQTIFIIIGNLIPIIGIIFLNWDYINFVFLYIIETVWIGVINYARFILPKDYYVKSLDSDEMVLLNESNYTEKQRKSTRKVPIVFYSILFILLTFLQIVIFNSLITDYRTDTSPDIINIEFILNAIILLLAHIYTFKEKEYDTKKVFKPIDPMIVFAIPFKRIAIQQTFIFIGAIIFLFFEVPAIFAIILILIKLYIDFKIYKYLFKIPA